MLLPIALVSGRDREAGGLPVEDAAFEVDHAVTEAREDFGGV